MGRLEWTSGAQADYVTLPDAVRSALGLRLNALRRGETAGATAAGRNRGDPPAIVLNHAGCEYRALVQVAAEPGTVGRVVAIVARPSRAKRLATSVLVVAGAILVIAGYRCWHALPPGLWRYPQGDRHIVLPDHFLRRSIVGDVAVIAGLGLVLLACHRVLLFRAVTNFGRNAARFLGAAASLAVAAGVIEHLLMGLASSAQWSITATSASSTIKWCCLVAACWLIPAALVVVGRDWAGARKDRDQTPWWDHTWLDAANPLPSFDETRAATGDDEVTEGANHDDSQWRWSQNYAVPRSGDQHQRRRDEHRSVTAVCLSGGGVRSACVAMGATQELAATSSEHALVNVDTARPARVTYQPDGRRLLDDVDYIISVSGGGYTAAARVMSVQPRGGTPTRGDLDSAPTAQGKVTLGLYWRMLNRLAQAIRSLAPRLPPPCEEPGRERVRLSDRMEPGSAEFGYIRAHSSYIADSPGDMLKALGEVAKNLILSMISLYAVAIAVGLAAGALVAVLAVAAFVPLDVSADLRASLDAAPEKYAYSLFAHATPAWWAIGIFAVLAVLFTAAAIATEERHADRAGERLRVGLLSVSRGCSALALLIATITVIVPGLMWLVAVIPGRNFVSQTSGAIAGVVGLQYFAALVVMVYRKRDTLPKGKTGALGKLPRGALKQLMVLATLAALLVVWLGVMASVAAGTFSYLTYLMYLQDNPDALVADVIQPPSAGFVAAFVGVSILVALVWFSDVTTLSLHPFYRMRLAKTFAVRRIAVGQDRDRGWSAAPYPAAEPTWLHTYGRVVDGPQFVFAAAAALTGEGKTAPGLDAQSFVLSADFVGGPQFGYLDTERLFHASPARLRRDLTVQAAMAISGAAFASEMGRMNRGFQTLLAASGARLGTWLPNPHYVRLLHETPPQYPLRALPALRAASYFFRELFGINRRDGRLLQITDGGHYENLGLVEALRRRCRVIYCFDGSGDPGRYLSSLSDAARLAKFELGVDITLEHTGPYAADNLTPGSGKQWTAQEAYSGLNARLTKGTVVRGTIQYPAAAGLGTPDDSRGILIFARAALWDQAPDWLLTYAAGSEVFPHDTTADQWFDEGQFAAYTSLGQLIGREAVNAKRAAMKHV